MAQAKSSDRNRWSLIASVIMIGLISLVQPGCNCGSSSGSAVPAPVASVFPPNDSTTALVDTNVIAFFGIDMNDSTIDATTFTLSEVGGVLQTATVTYDAATRTATLDPGTDLLPGTQYRATLSATIEDAAGNMPLTNDYVWSFTVSQAMLLVSKNSSDVTANNTSKVADIDASGRYIVFESTATNLVSNITVNGINQIYRKDTLTGEVLLASSDNSGLVAADIACSNPRISSNGRFIVFESRSTNLDPVVNSNGITQIFIKDMENGSTGAIEIASRNSSLAADNSANTAANARVSDDGRYVLFQSADPNMSAIDGGGSTQIYLKDMSDETVDMVSRTTAAVGNADSTNPDMSQDGSFIVFESIASNLAPTSNFRHIYFVKSTLTQAVEQISVTTGGVDANANSFNPSISDDGTRVVFESDATNLDIDTNGTTDIYIRDRLIPLTSLVSANPATQDSGNGASTHPDLNGSGDFVVFESDANDLDGGNAGVIDIFIRDLSQLPAIDIIRVNIPVSGSASTADTNNPVISADGRYVSFDSIEGYTLDGTDIFLDVYRAYNRTFQ